MSGYLQIVRFFLGKLKNDHIGAYSAMATLYIVMSTIPFLLILTYFLRFTSVTANTIITGIELLMPGGAPEMIETIIKEVYQNSGKMLIPAFIIAVYSAGKAVQSLRYALNMVYDIQETRNWFVLRFRAMLETFLLILIMLALMILVVFGKNIHEVIVLHAPFAAVLTSIVLKFRIVIIFFILIPFFCFIYKFLPNRTCSFKSQLVGAIGCAASWYVFTGFLLIYIYFFHGFSLYGSFTFLLLVVFWLNICLYIFLVCGGVNSMLEILWAELKETHAKNKLAKQLGEEVEKPSVREPSTYGQYIHEKEEERKAKEEQEKKNTQQTRSMVDIINELEWAIDKEHPSSKG